MQTASLYSFLSSVEARKRASGFEEGPEATDLLRNRGASRTPAKRALLARAEARAISARIPAVPSYR